MIVLNDKQVAFILDDLRRNGIEKEDLQFSLLDHICCVVEDEMSPETNFEEFYRSVLPRFFKKDLREIQEETDLLLTFKQYYAMKKVMLYSGSFSAVCFIIGGLFKVMHWPGASILLLSAIVCFSFLFLPILFLIKSKESKVARDKSVMAIATVFGSLISLATLFKIMHWPGANVMWLSSLGILFFLFLPIYFFGGIKNPETKLNTIISSILILTAGGLLFTLTMLRSSKWTEDAYLLSESGIEKSYDFLSAQNQLLYDEQGDSLSLTDQELNGKTDKLCGQIESTKMLLLNGVKAGKTTESEILRLEGSNVNITGHLLFQKNGSTGSHLKELKIAINELSNFIYTSYKLKVNTLFDTKNVVSHKNETISWEEANFSHVSLQQAITNLNQLLLKVRIAESAALKC